MPVGRAAAQTDIGIALGQPPGGDLRLEPRQRGAEAEMDAVAEGEMRVGIAADVEALGVGEGLRRS